MRFYVIAVEVNCPLDTFFESKYLVKAKNFENAKQIAKEYDKNCGMTKYTGTVIGYYDEDDNYKYISLL